MAIVSRDSSPRLKAGAPSQQNGGCADSNAGCWAGGNALGDMQFAGTGTATGSWPYRNSYTTGNKSGQITFAINGVTYTPVAAGPWMRIATADGSGVDGVSVTRW